MNWLDCLLSREQNFIAEPSVPAKIKFHSKSVADVRAFAERRLATLSRAVGLACTESYLFRDDYWCGMSFTLGVMRAEWHLDSTQVSFFNDVQLIEQANFVSPQEQGRRAA